jgi:uncharacterized damage-inducible protein DinB
MTTPIEPDTKDWTWVLERPCPECGYRGSDVDAAEIPATLRATTPRWTDALARPDARERPAPGTWSVLEYAAHVRDVHRIFGERLRLILDEVDPLFANWDQDATAVAERYDLQDPAVVAVELAEAAEETAARFAAVPDDAWQRPGRRSNGSSFTALTLGQYYLHDVVHHTHDVHA